MIASLRGAVSAIRLDSLVLDVGGVGYLVYTSPQTLASVRHGEQATIFTELVVREDSMTLYGFLTHEEVELFRTVQSVSGIGPRIGIAVLAVMSPAQFANAVIAEDIKTITTIPGIGPKGAKRLALELKDKVVPFVAPAALPDTVEAAPADPDESAALNPAAADVIHGLIGLGWGEKPATDAVTAVLEDHESAEPGSAAALESGRLLRLALRHLGGRL